MTADEDPLNKSVTASEPTLQQEPYPRYRWVIIAQLWLHQELAFLLSSTMGILLPAIRADIPFGMLGLGWVGSARSAAQCLNLPSSPFLVRLNPKRLLAILLTLMALMILAQSRATSLIWFFSCFVIYAAAVALSGIPSALMRLQWVPPGEFATVMGTGLGFAAIVQTLSLMTIPLILKTASWRTVVTVYGAIVVVLMVLWLKAGRERITASYRKGMADSTGLAALKGALRHKEFLLVGLAMMGGATAYVSTMLFLPTHFVEERGFSLQTAGFINSLMPLGGMVASFTVGPFSDRIGRRKPTIWPLGFVLPILYLFLLLGPAWPLLLAGAAFVLGYAAYAPFPALQTIPYELPEVAPSEVTIGLSLAQTVMMAGNFVGPIVVGAVADVTGSVRAGLLCLCFLPVILALICLFLPETGPIVSRRRRESLSS